MWQLGINTASTGPVARMFAFLLHHSLVCLPCATLVSPRFYFESRTNCTDDKFLPFGGPRSPGSASESKLTCMDYGTIYCIGKQVEHNFSQITNLWIRFETISIPSKSPLQTGRAKWYASRHFNCCQCHLPFFRTSCIMAIYLVLRQYFVAMVYDAVSASMEFEVSAGV